ncbi:MAG: TIGR01244 family sulfur transferase [Sphingomonadales bacterium]|nr:TIGR01244 family sulfur transferase [Sphingomonadales bacterium]
MPFKPITDDFLAAPQLTADEFAEAAEAGVRVVINNRPDGEEPGQIPTAEAAELAAKAGLAYHHIPVVSGQLSIEAVDAFAEVIKDAEGPVLAYCRSGTRSTTLWALTAALSGAHPPAVLIERAGAAGYDLRPLAQILEDLAAKGAGR